MFSTRLRVRRGVAAIAVSVTLALAACSSFDAASTVPPTEAGNSKDDSGAESGTSEDATIDRTTDSATESSADAPAACTDDDSFADVTEVTDQGDVTSVRLAADGVTAFSSFFVTAADEDIDEGPFPKAAALYSHAVVSPEADTHPAPVDDDKLLFYEHGATGARAVARATRAQAGQKFTSVTLDVLGLGSVQSREPYAIGDGTVLYFTRDTGTSASRDIYRASASGATWTIATVGLSSSANEGHPVVSKDELTIFFSRADLDGPADIWMATRTSTAVPFSAGLQTSGLAGVVDGGSPSDDRPTWLSADRCTLLFVSNRSGAYRAYRATRTAH